jgi:hypothetical protein
MTPEAKARQNIDALLVASGWHVRNVAEAIQIRVVADANRHLSIVHEVEAEVDTNLQRAPALRNSVLAKSFERGD